MSEQYVVRTLSPERILQAFPVVSVVDGAVSKEDWAAYAAALVGSPNNGVGQGIITVQCEQGYIHGLSVYQVKRDLRRGRVLEIENFAVVELFGSTNVAKILLDGLESLAREQQCHCMLVGLLNPTMRRWLRKPDSPAVDIFKEAGFQSEPLKLRKCFDHGA